MFPSLENNLWSRSFFSVQYVTVENYQPTIWSSTPNQSFCAHEMTVKPERLLCKNQSPRIIAMPVNIWSDETSELIEIKDEKKPHSIWNVVCFVCCNQNAKHFPCTCSLLFIIAFSSQFSSCRFVCCDIRTWVRWRALARSHLNHRNNEGTILNIYTINCYR